MEAAPSYKDSISVKPTRCLNTNDFCLKRILVNCELGRTLEGKVVAKCEALYEKYVCND